MLPALIATYAKNKMASAAAGNGTQQQDQGGQAFKRYVIYGTIALVVAGFGWWFISSRIKKARVNKELNKSYSEDQPAYYAQKLFLTTNGAGTLEEQMRQVLISIPSKAFFKQVVESYARITGGDSLLDDMARDLQMNEYNEMLAIIAAKPDTGDKLQPVQLTPVQYKSWANRLKAAFEYRNWQGLWLGGTDVDAIKAVFHEVPSQSAFQTLAETYKNLYDSDFWKELHSELFAGEEAAVMKIKNSKPK